MADVRHDELIDKVARVIEQMAKANNPEPPWVGGRIGPLFTAHNIAEAIVGEFERQGWRPDGGDDE